jgi:hypothetical protein
LPGASLAMILIALAKEGNPKCSVGKKRRSQNQLRLGVP